MSNSNTPWGSGGELPPAAAWVDDLVDRKADMVRKAMDGSGVNWLRRKWNRTRALAIVALIAACVLLCLAVAAVLAWALLSLLVCLALLLLGLGTASAAAAVVVLLVIIILVP